MCAIFVSCIKCIVEIDSFRVPFEREKRGERVVVAFDLHRPTRRLFF